jgi:cell wall-associated NlpC family hydrolase
LKQLIYLLLLTILFVSCKPSSTIVTSKQVAQKQGTYKELPKSNESTKRVAVSPKTNTEEKEVASTKKSSKNKLVENEESDYEPDSENTPYLVKQIIFTAMEYDGVKYRSGGTTPAGMDCSGLVCTVFKAYDISLPRSSNDMSKVGQKLKRNEIQKGDLVFFKTNGRNVINHVGLVTEVNGDEILFIHSSVQRGVIISSTNEPYYQRTFAQANRIIN